MSEKLTQQTQEPLEVNEPLAHEFGSQTGALDIHAVTERIGELSGRVIEAGRVAFHGLSSIIAQRRMERAGSTMERMDHKEALYKNMGEVATGNRPTESHMGKKPKPRTFAERFMDKRADKRAFKRAYQDAAHARTRKNFGGKEKVDTMGVRTKIADQQRRQDVKRQYRQGDITATERRVSLTAIKGTPTAFESSAQRRARRAKEKSVKKLEKTARQKHLTNWRARRREKAIESIKKNHHRAEYHKARAESIRTGNEVTYDMPDRPKRGQGGYVSRREATPAKRPLDADQKRAYPPRPSKQRNGSAASSMRRGYPVATRRKQKPARTEFGKRWQQQQEINRQGVK